MTQVIETAHGRYEFEPVHLYHGRGAIDPTIARDNLLMLKCILDRHGVRFGIIYGTLLGAVRQGAFIPWDEDVDVFLLDEVRGLFHGILHELRDVGLELVRCEGDLYSLMRNENYIDLYFFRRAYNRRVCNEDTVKASYLERDEWIEFLGSRFITPFKHRAFLAGVYGSDWMTPKINAPARPWSTWKKIRECAKERFPALLRLKQLFSRIR